MPSQYTDEQVQAANQRLLNEAWAHLSATKEKSLRPGTANPLKASNCSYAGSGCAFAPAIEKEFRKEADDGYNSASALLRNRTEWIKPWARGASGTFANIVQRSHDNTQMFAGDEFLEQFKSNVENEIKVWPGYSQLTLPW